MVSLRVPASRIWESWDVGDPGCWDLGCGRPRILETRHVRDPGCQTHGMLETWGVETQNFEDPACQTLECGKLGC